MPAKSKQSIILHLPKPLKKPLAIGAIGFFLFLAVVAIVLDQKKHPIAQTARQELTEATAPVVHTLSLPGIWLRNIQTSFKRHIEAFGQNQSLREENIKLKHHLIEFATLKAENAQLKQLLNFVSQKQYSVTSASINMNITPAFVKSAIINAGEGHTIKKHQAVIGGLGLVGRVIETYPEHSRVLLITDIHSNVPIISSITRNRAILAGQNNNAPKLTFMNRTAQIQTGEIAITSGDGQLLPPGLPIGIIYKKNKRFFVQPFEKWHHLEQVSVIAYTPPQKKPSE